LFRKRFNHSRFLPSTKRECARIVLAALTDNFEKKSSNKNEHISIGWMRPFYIYSLNPLTPSLVRFVADQINSPELTGPSKNSVQIEANNFHDYIELEACIELIQKIIVSRQSGVFDLGTGQLESNISLIERLFPEVSVSTARESSLIPGTSLTAQIDWKNKI
jgi:hypothetical protein